MLETKGLGLAGIQNRLILSLFFLWYNEKKVVILMCGRFVVSYGYEELLQMIEDDFDLIDLHTENKYPNYNIAPTDNILSILYANKSLRIGEIRWGAFSGFPIINIRSETVMSKFKPQLMNNRIIIPATGYYEWDSSKNPHYFHDEHILYFAGVYDNNKQGFYASIITKKANKDISLIHDRMPVILSKEDALTYLKTTDALLLQTLLKQETPISVHRVKRSVNNVRNNSKENIEPYQENTLFS